MKRILNLLILLSFGLFSLGQEGMNTGMIYGENFAYNLTAPEGWILDNESGVDQGLFAVFYRKGESWKKAVTVMYTNTASLEEDTHRTLDQLIKFDIDDFKSQYSDLKIEKGNDITITEKNIAKVYYLSGKSYGNFEAMAYIDAGKTGIMIIMSSRTKEGFDNSLTAFESLVKSYFFIADKVKIEKNN
jgi:hypothetical protein